jgi:2'-5' RNA ligase
MPHCLVIVPVPEVEPYVSHLRERFDPAARRGLGAHITLLHAPLPSGGVDSAVFAAVAELCTTTPSFAYVVPGLGRFPGSLYLAVEPITPFASLRKCLVRVSPDTAAKSFVPHISIVRRAAASDDELGVERELTQLLAHHGPLQCVCRELELLEDSAGKWHSVQRFALNGRRDTP